MTAQEYEQFLHDAEVKLARLKALYEQWFQGIERTEPVIVRKDLDRSLELLKKNMPRNTALRFRTQQLSARYGTYGIYWGRIGRQIEEGTYKRILQRVNRTSSPDANAKKDESGWEIDVDIDEVEAPAAKGVDFSEGDLDAILGALAAPEEKPKTKPTRSLSPFGFGAGLAPSQRPASSSAATFGKPADTAPKPAPAATPVTTTPVTATVAKPAVVAVPAPASPARPPVAAPPIVPKPSAPVPISRPMGPPPVAAPVPMSRPAAPGPPSSPSGVRPAPTASLDEPRLRAIHASYVEARRKNNEAADVRYETLADNLQKMIPKLREKHGGKAIDFEVVVQNGKVGLKPKVSG